MSVSPRARIAWLDDEVIAEDFSWAVKPDLPPGEYIVRLQSDDGEVHEQVVQIQPNKVVQIEWSFTDSAVVENQPDLTGVETSAVVRSSQPGESTPAPAPPPMQETKVRAPPAVLRLTTDPPGATVEIHGEIQGNTPLLWEYAGADDEVLATFAIDGREPTQALLPIPRAGERIHYDTYLPPAGTGPVVISTRDLEITWVKISCKSSGYKERAPVVRMLQSTVSSPVGRAVLQDVPKNGVCLLTHDGKLGKYPGLVRGGENIWLGEDAEP